MTVGSLAMLVRRRELSPERESVARAVFVLPAGFEPARLLLTETAGAAALYAAFKSAGVESPLWHAVFHAVSAFRTAGFSTFPNSLAVFAAGSEPVGEPVVEDIAI